ncbi:MAG: LysR family transcriptional regulator [Pseudobacteriovorax sp.]|nr:LysR family transcriptional regulator [Pseudobacteriovorax sp.]
MQWLNYHHLYYFYVIATEGSVTEATKKLRLAQSTLSAQLKQFEDVVGYKLFERTNRKLVLNDVGKRVFDYAHEIFSLGNELRESLGQFEDSLRTSLRLGVMDSIPKILVRDIFKNISENYESKVTVAEESLAALCERLLNHEIDVILANDKPLTQGKMSRFHAKLIGELRVIFVTSPGFSHLKEGFPRSLNAKPMIMPGEHSPLRREVMEHFKIKHVQPMVVAEVDDIELQKMFVLDGHGFTVLPEISVKEELETGELLTLGTTPICHENLWLITAHRLVNNPIVRKLLDSYRP